MPNAAGWSRIERFVGYGNRNAPIVFIGMEEGLSNPRNLNDHLEARARFRPTMDLKSAHDGISGTERFFDARDPRCQRTWRPMSDLMLRREGTVPSREDRNFYQANRLGRSRGDTLLMELLPYPHVRSTHWVYRNRYRTRDEYESNILPERLKLLRAELSSRQRDLVICYGKRKWRHFKTLMEMAFRLQNDDWRPRQSGSLQVATTQNTRIVLTCHFSSRHFNSDRQLNQFARVALA
jgi:hypothetical protein